MALDNSMLMCLNNLAVPCLLHSLSDKLSNSSFPGNQIGPWPRYLNLHIHADIKLYLNKVGSVCLLFVIWATFSSCFYYQALESVTHQSVILVCFLNVGLYVFFTLFSFCLSRPPINPTSRVGQKIFFRFPKRDTIAICFCAPAKSVSIGAPLIGVMWGMSFSGAVQSLVMAPIVLYQAEQILCGQIMVMLFRRWARDEWMAQPIISDEETATEDTTTVTEREEDDFTHSEETLGTHSLEIKL